MKHTITAIERTDDGALMLNLLPKNVIVTETLTEELISEAGVQNIYTYTYEHDWITPDMLNSVYWGYYEDLGEAAAAEERGLAEAEARAEDTFGGASCSAVEEAMEKDFIEDLPF